MQIFIITFQVKQTTQLKVSMERNILVTRNFRWNCYDYLWEKLRPPQGAKRMQTDFSVSLQKTWCH